MKSSVEHKKIRFETTENQQTIVDTSASFARDRTKRKNKDINIPAENITNNKPRSDSCSEESAEKKKPLSTEAENATAGTHTKIEAIIEIKPRQVHGINKLELNMEEERMIKVISVSEINYVNCAEAQQAEYSNDDETEGRAIQANATHKVSHLRAWASSQSLNSSTGRYIL